MNPVKNVLIIILLAIVVAPALAQKKPAPIENPQNCYAEWFSIFRSRGGKTVPDGMQEVIITLRSADDQCHCFMGRIEVAGGKIKPPLFIQKQDGSYETFASAGKGLDANFVGKISQDELFTISDAMSVSFQTTDQETGRLFFYQWLADKPKANRVAPSPSSLVR